MPPRQAPCRAKNMSIKTTVWAMWYSYTIITATVKSLGV